MLEVYYCRPSSLSSKSWASGSVRVKDNQALGWWLREQVGAGPIIITAITKV